MKKDIEYLLNVISNFGLMDLPQKGLDPTMYHTGTYYEDLKLCNRLIAIKKKYSDCPIKISTVLNWCECIYEPRGDGGLEGYQLSEKYYCYKINNIYHRVYPDESDGYYETCSKQTFNKYFKLLD